VFQRTWVYPLVTSLLVLLGGGKVTGAEQPSSEWWEKLALRSLEARAVPASSPWQVVVFLDPECPVANRYIPVLNALAAEFARGGFVFLGAYTDPTANLEQLRAHAREFRIAFPTVDDRAQRLARYVGASYAAEAVVLNADGHVLYRGRIDDRVGENGAARPTATHEELRSVLQRLSRGEPGPFPGVPGFGCSLVAPAKTP
jgi:hypothetical protein